MRAGPASPPRILVAGMGNVLRGDDGFGPAVIDALASAGNLPAGVQSVDVGIGGVNLVHELMEGYDALVLVDAVDRDGEPGSLYVLETTVPDVASIPAIDRWRGLTDLHQTIPEPALIMARAVGVLPPIVRIVGCQPAEIDEFVLELSPAVQKAVPTAVEAIQSLLTTIANQHMQNPTPCYGEQRRE